MKLRDVNLSCISERWFTVESSTLPGCHVVFAAALTDIAAQCEHTLIIPHRHVAEHEQRWQRANFPSIITYITAARGVSQLMMELFKQKLWQVQIPYRSLEECESEKVFHIRQHGRCSCPCGWWSPWWCTTSRHPQNPGRHTRENHLEKYNQEADVVAEGEKVMVLMEMQQTYSAQVGIWK